MEIEHHKHLLHIHAFVALNTIGGPRVKHPFLWNVLQGLGFASFIDGLIGLLFSLGLTARNQGPPVPGTYILFVASYCKKLDLSLFRAFPLPGADG